jgi:hypothetical protein
MGLQELIFAKDIIVACSPDSIGWPALQANCTIFKQAEYFLDFIFDGSHIGHRIAGLRTADPNTMERFGHDGYGEILGLATLLAKHRHKSQQIPETKSPVSSAWYRP